MGDLDNKDKIKVEEVPPEHGALYDDLPPASQAIMNTFGTALASLLLREVNSTLQDVNRALALLNEIERYTAPRRSVSGELIPSALSVYFQQMIRRYGLDEAVREQIKQLQATALKLNIEAALRQAWQGLREQSGRLRESISQSTMGTIRPEQYVATEEAPANNGYGPAAANGSEPAYVAPAPEPVRELLVDVFNEPDTNEVVLIAEHPGLDEATIEVTLYHDIVTLRALGMDGQPYSHEVLLPFPVDASTFSRQYRNGVLQIRYSKSRLY